MVCVYRSVWCVVLRCVHWLVLAHESPCFCPISYIQNAHIRGVSMFSSLPTYTETAKAGSKRRSFVLVYRECKWRTTNWTIYKTASSLQSRTSECAMYGEFVCFLTGLGDRSERVRMWAAWAFYDARANGVCMRVYMQIARRWCCGRRATHSPDAFSPCTHPHIGAT